MAYHKKTISYQGRKYIIKREHGSGRYVLNAIDAGRDIDYILEYETENSIDFIDFPTFDSDGISVYANWCRMVEVLHIADSTIKFKNYRITHE